MYGIFTYVYHKNQPHVGKYTIHGWYGLYIRFLGCKLKKKGHWTPSVQVISSRIFLGNGTDFLTDFASTPHAIREAKWCNSRKQSKIRKKNKWGNFCFRCFWSWILFICHICVVSGASFSKDLEVVEVPYQLLCRFAWNLGFGIGNAAKLWWRFRLFGIFSAWDFFRFPCWKQPKKWAECILYPFFLAGFFGNCSNMPIMKNQIQARALSLFEDMPADLCHE